MRFDAHIHLFEHGYSGTRDAGAELAEYEQARTVYRIARALVVGYEGDPQFAGNNDYILRLAAKRDWIVPLYYLDAQRATAAEVHDAVDRGAQGFSLYLGSAAELAASIPSEVWTALAAHRAPLSVNVAPEALASLSDVASALDGAPLVVSHLGLPGTPTGAHAATLTRMTNLLRLAAHDNVLVKLSALYAIDPVYPHESAQEHVRLAIDAFGPERLVWGSDFAPGLDVVSGEELFTLPDWVEAQFPGELRDGLLQTTLRRAIKKD